MAVVEVENKSKQVIRFDLDVEGEQYAYLLKMLKRDELERVEIVKPAARKPAASASK